MTATLSTDLQFGLAPQRLKIFWTFFFLILYWTLTVSDFLIVTAIAFYA